MAIISAKKEKTRRKPYIKNRIAPEVEDAVVKMAFEYPAHGQARSPNELRKIGILLSAGGVRSIWLRHGLDVVCLYRLWLLWLFLANPNPFYHREAVFLYITKKFPKIIKKTTFSLANSVQFLNQLRLLIFNSHFRGMFCVFLFDKQFSIL